MTEATAKDSARGERATQQSVDDVVIRFAGDSGDGMQLTGGQFTSTSALLGNDLATLPDFPAEIRAPQGTLPGVSAFQVRIADYDIHTPGDQPDVLVAMNPAALKKSIGDLKENGIVIVNTNEFSGRNLKKAGYEQSPLEDGSLASYRVHAAEITTMTHRALEDSSLDSKSKNRCRNMFALGMIYWLFSRPLDNTVEWLNTKFKKKPEIANANEKVLRAGFNYSDTVELFQIRYEGRAGVARGGGSTATSWATARSRSAWWPPAGAAGCRSSWARTRSRPPARSSTSWRATRVTE